MEEKLTLQIIAQIQFKRLLYSNKSLEETITLLNNNLNPPLQDGEPLICSYQETINGETKTKFLLAVGALGEVHIIPAFRNQQDINEFISSRSEQGNLIDQISSESDFVISTVTDGKTKFTIKDNLKNI